MRKQITIASALFIHSLAAVAEEVKLPEGEVGTKAAASTVLRKGIDGEGLTMAEKWRDDVIVCKREKLTGSRFARKVCHSRADWQAMRANGRETVEHAQRLYNDSGN